MDLYVSHTMEIIGHQQLFSCQNIVFYGSQKKETHTGFGTTWEWFFIFGGNCPFKALSLLFK